MNDAVLRRGGIKGADIALVNTDAADDIFSLVEVHRGIPEGPVLRPPPNVPVPDSAQQEPEAERSKRNKRKKQG